MAKKKIWLTLLISLTLSLGSAGILNNAKTVVQAASNYRVQVRGRKKVRLYSTQGKKTKYYAYAKRKYTFSRKKYLHLRGKKYLAYQIKGRWLLARQARLVKNSPRYQTATLKLPHGYTRSALLAAYQGKPSKKFIAASIKGMMSNDFSRVKPVENASDRQIIDLTQLSPDQQKELANFSLRLINEVRRQLGLKDWVYSAGAQKLADDIATEYEANHRSIKEGHYIAGIVRACKQNGLNLDDNYVEDMSGFNNPTSRLTMGAMKKNIYFSLKQMIFGYTGSSEAKRKDRQLYREWQHAGDLFNTQGSRHDGDFNYFGFSVSKTGQIYSLHFINIPSFIVNNPKYNLSFNI